MPRGFIPPQNEEEHQLCRRIEDLVHTVCQRGISRQTMFLSDREQVLATSILQKVGFNNFVFYGGCPQAQRCVLCLFDEQEVDVALFAQIDCLHVKPSFGAKTLAHKDYLGAILALGINRNCVGDIVCTKEDGAYVFVAQKMAQHITDQLFEVGRYAVTVAVVDASEVVQQPQEHTQKTATVSSLRADAVLAAMLQCNRALAAQFIEKKLVQINHVLVMRAHTPVYEGDEFTVRGKGKMKLCFANKKTRKDRIFIEYNIY